MTPQQALTELEKIVYSTNINLAMAERASECIEVLKEVVYAKENGKE